MAKAPTAPKSSVMPFEGTKESPGRRASFGPPITSINTRIRMKDISVAEVVERLNGIEKSDRFLLKPDTKYTQRWDLVILVCLFFTATITPYEVALLETKLDWLFWLNRLVDFLFIKDMVVNCITMYWDEDGVLVKSRGKIVNRYLHGWLVLDFITVLPFDFAKYMVSESAVQVVKLVRLMRLLKLFRLLRASRIFTRWETKLSVKHKVVLTFKLVFLLIFLNHWLACCWIMVAVLQDDKRSTWLTNWMEGQNTVTDECSGSSTFANGAARYTVDGCFGPGHIYSASLHWSMMTVTSIGYGDIVPSNTVEYIWGVIFMLISGVAWAYIIGEICGIAANGNPVTKAYYASTDNMNQFMSEQRIPSELRQRVRLFLMQQKVSLTQRNQNKIMANLSPNLAGEMVSKGERWVKDRMVFWCRYASMEFYARLIVGMGCNTYPPRDTIPCKEVMYILQKGTVYTDSLVQISSKSIVWNEDVVLYNKNLRNQINARTITYVQVDFLERSFLMQVLDEGWAEGKKVKTDIRWMAVFRGMQFRKNHNDLLPLEWEILNNSGHRQDYESMLRNRKGSDTSQTSADGNAMEKKLEKMMGVITTEFNRINKKIDDMKSNTIDLQR